MKNEATIAAPATRIGYRPDEDDDFDDETRPVQRWRANVCGNFTQTYFVDAADRETAKRKARSLFFAGVQPETTRMIASFVGAYETKPKKETEAAR